MTTDPVVLLVLSPRDWAARLHRYAVDHGGLHVKARVLRQEEVAIDGLDVLVVDDTTSFLSRRLIEEIHSRSAKVLGVYDSNDFPEGRLRLLDLGVDGVIEAASEPEEFVRRIGQMRSLRPTAVPPVGASTSDAGRLLVVGGPFGGTGSTEVAIGVAAAIHRGGGRVVLVDADDVAPSIAQRLGLPVVPNLRTLVDQSRRGEMLEVDRTTGFDVVCGLPNPRDWAELRPLDVSSAIGDLANGTDAVVVVDISSGIERLPGDGRFRLARRIIADAHTVLGVGVATPNGVSRLLDWAAEVSAINGSARLVLVLNRVPAGGFVRSEVAREIERVFAPSEVGFLPEDRRVRRAAWEGGFVSRGSFSRGVTSLIAGVAG
jgi:MinD-like ATPase involved in chromosome partitioning or flagellar assembly